jgi:thiamine transport system permease protein
VADGLVIAAAAVFLLVPLGMVVARGLAGLAMLPAGLWLATLRSVAVAMGATVLCRTVALTLALAVARRARGARGIEVAATLPLAASGLVLGTGLFLMVQPHLSPERLALPVTVLVNATLALPFVFRLLLPEAKGLEADYGRLSAALGLTGLGRLRWVVLPRLARPLGFAAGVAAALSMGDLGVIALFAGEQAVTLPLLVQRLMGAYRMEAAAGAALVLVTVSFALFALFEWGGRRAAA